MLTNPAYCGDTPVGQNRRWKGLKRFNAFKPTVVKDTHTALVSREVFELVQAKIRERKTGKRKVRNDTSPLAGVLICGQCGHAMVRGGGKSKTDRYFYCQSPAKRPQLHCKYRSAKEADVLRVITVELAKAIDFETLQGLQARPDKPDATKLDALRARAGELEKDIANGSKNILKADPELFEAMQAELAGWKAELQKIKNTLTMATTEATRDERVAWLKWWEGAKSKLVEVAPEREVAIDIPSIGRTLAAVKATNPGASKRVVFRIPKGIDRPMTYKAPAVHAKPEVLRDLLHRLNAKLVCHWLPKGDRRWLLDYGQLTAELDIVRLDHAGHYSYRPDTPRRIIKIDVTVRFGEEAPAQ
jgi:hypothetical protein